MYKYLKFNFISYKKPNNGTVKYLGLQSIAKNRNNLRLITIAAYSGTDMIFMK